MLSFYRTGFLVAILAVLVCVRSGLAGPATDYTVTRSYSEQSLGVQATASSTTVTLQGAGSGNAGDMLTVTETITPGGAIDIGTLSIVADQGGVVEDIGTGGGESVFDSADLIEHQGRPSIGTNNRVVYNGGNSYTSVAETGRDIWAPGDTFVYAHNQATGDFDVAVRID